MKKILKGAVVLLTALVMVFSTIAVTADTNDETQINQACIKSTNHKQSESVVQPLLGPVMFSQPPVTPDDPWAFYTSDYYLGYLCMDDFWDVEDEICDVHWWGLSLIWDNNWYNCDPQGMMFEIIIYDQYQNAVCMYTNLTPTPIPTPDLPDPEPNINISEIGERLWTLNSFAFDFEVLLSLKLDCIDEITISSPIACIDLS